MMDGTGDDVLTMFAGDDAEAEGGAMKQEEGDKFS